MTHAMGLYTGVELYLRTYIVYNRTVVSGVKTSQHTELGVATAKMSKFKPTGYSSMAHADPQISDLLGEFSLHEAP